MRIRKLSTTSVSATSPPYSSSSPSTSPFHSSSSVITAASSTDSSTSSSQHTSPSTRCKGLDLLVKAIHHVSAGGSIVGVPYIQRRSVTRRRRRSNYLRFNQFFVTDHQMTTREEREKDSGSEPKSKKQMRRVMALPSKYHDSVLQPWRLRSRSGIKIND